MNYYSKIRYVMLYLLTKQSLIILSITRVYKKPPVTQSKSLGTLKFRKDIFSIIFLPGIKNRYQETNWRLILSQVYLCAIPILFAYTRVEYGTKKNYPNTEIYISLHIVLVTATTMHISWTKPIECIWSAYKLIIIVIRLTKV